MDEKEKNINDASDEIEEEEFEEGIITLLDEDDNELRFMRIGILDREENRYHALLPVDENGNETSDEYIILKSVIDKNGEETLETIEDDDEFDDIADIFDDEFSNISYDEH